MPRIHFVQQWLNLLDPAMEEALYDTPICREFVGLDASEDNLPDKSTILRLRHLLEANNLNLQIWATVNATLAANDVTQAHALVQGEETDVCTDAGYQGVRKSEETRDIDVNWHVTMRPGKLKVLDKNTPMGPIMDQL